MTSKLIPEDWGLHINQNRELCLGKFSTVEMANKYGTPLHVVHVGNLRKTISSFREAFINSYPGKTSVHYAFKANTVPGILKLIKDNNLKAEIMSLFELELALKLGYQGRDIIVNGPHKPREFLKNCIQNEVRLIVVDAISEIETLNQLGNELDKDVDILFRINPDYVPKGMNYGTATASRKGCAFGLDLKGIEIDHAFSLLERMERVRFQGLHFHIGSGVSRPGDYSNALKRLNTVIEKASNKNLEINILDIGGGIGSSTSREMTTREMLLYQGFEKLPKLKRTGTGRSFKEFASAISKEVANIFKDKALPELILEPGRSITSSNQFLLLTVHDIKERPGIKKWLITDGGIGTVTMPTYYECHQVFLCNEPNRPESGKVTIIGPVCFAGDIVYRNIAMPHVEPGEVLAIMDSGAYFTGWESSFSFPRSAIIVVDHNEHKLIRRRETFEDMVIRDDIGQGF
jgi:diaminopimelate decarboxylase